MPYACIHPSGWLNMQLRSHPRPVHPVRAASVKLVHACIRQRYAVHWPHSATLKSADAMIARVWCTAKADTGSKCLFARWVSLLDAFHCAEVAA